MMPQRKVIAGGLSGAACVLLLKLLREAWGIEFTGDDALSLWVVVNFVLQYLVPNAKVPDESLSIPPEPPNAS